MSKKTKLGLMFGSYDPPHLGHVRTAMTAKEEEKLDRVLMIPVRSSPFKKGGMRADFNSKVRMCEIISEPYSEWLDVLDYGEDFPSSYVDGLRSFKNTLRQVKEQNPDSEIYIVSGEDFRKKLCMAMAALEVSRYIAKAMSKVESLLDLQYADNLAQRLKDACEILHDAKLLDINRSSLDDGVSISSTDIRDHLIKGYEDIAGLPDEVEEFIRTRGLYMDMG